MVAPGGGHASLLGRTFGSYEVFGLIGRGAVGTVYAATDLRLKRPVALKVLLGSLARDPNVVKSFHREAQAAAPLRHPNIVRIYSAGIEEGTPYIAMEYVEGEPLDRFVRRKGRIKWQSALYIAHQVAEALDCAHGRGIIHRDVKPANIMLDHSGRVCLTDFGIANIQTDDSASSAEGGFAGTPHYMSPEQCAGHALTPSSDLYSLGVTLYQMIAGGLPFNAESPVALIKSITSDEAPRLSRIVPDVPDDVSRLAAYLIQKEPHDRPEDARAVCSLIARIQAENGGGSALPAALSSFIREQAQPVSLNVVAPTPWRERLRLNTHKASTSRQVPRRVRWWPLALCGSLAVALLGAVITAQYSSSGSFGVARGPAPTLTVGTQHSLGADTTLVELRTPQFAIADLAWVGDKNTVLLDMAGRKGTLAQNATGIIALDTQTGTLSGVRGPAGPALTDEFTHAPVLMTALSAVPVMPESSPLSGAVVDFAYGRGLVSASRPVQALAHRWNQAGPTGAIVFQARADEVMRPERHIWDESIPASVAPSPDGYTVCAVLSDVETGANYLAERDIRWKSVSRMGPRKTGPGGRILPRSVQYSPDGAAIAYIRRSGMDTASLWLVASDGADVDGTNLTPGAICVSAAFHPSGHELAVALDRNDGADPEIETIRSDTGAVEAALGRGLLGKESWHPSGDFLIVSARAAGAESAAGAPRQLWAIEAASPHRRKQLTSLPQGVSGPCAVSRTGRYAAVAEGGVMIPGVVVVDLNAKFSRLFD